MMSGRLSSALRRVPATKPSCTESVSQLAALALRLHSRLSAGTTAEPLNQSDMPSSSAIASSASVRQRDGEASFDEAGFCKREIVTFGVRRLVAALESADKSAHSKNYLSHCFN